MARLPQPAPPKVIGFQPGTRRKQYRSNPPSRSRRSERVIESQSTSNATGYQNRINVRGCLSNDSYKGHGFSVRRENRSHVSNYFVRRKCQLMRLQIVGRHEKQSEGRVWRTLVRKH